MKRLVLVLLIIVAAVMMFLGTAFADTANSVKLGVGGVFQLMPHCTAYVALVEYEHLLDSKISVLGRAIGVNYKFDDGVYYRRRKTEGL